MRQCWLIVVLFLLASCGPVKPEPNTLDFSVRSEPCQPISVQQQDYVVCQFLPATHAIRLFHSDAQGEPYRQFINLVEALEAQGQSLIFAMNGGMYHEDRRPVGYYRDEHGDRATVNLNEGPGNFHLKPNGVFWLKGQSAGINESADYLDQAIDPDYATQSGPLLVLNNQVHPGLNPDGVSRKRRNGVGVSADGKKVYFVISDSAVTFHEFASLFRDQLATPNALFLDGQVSRIYAPHINRNELGADLGPIVGVVE